ncbi:hypothetical protein DM860_018080 [Cuscuta australis]|uniref:Phospholipid/glycerol acyltransferase domain-containing protein n=1 Tax=Cuscuta australis TaxID=267555 RepID=A0A328DAS5_9ASTE|nr:hypothetical protein DM860_018080 [Cuscuta australis]
MRQSATNMVFPMVFLKLAQWLLYQVLAKSCYKTATTLIKKSTFFFFFFTNPSSKPLHNISTSSNNNNNNLPHVTKYNPHHPERKNQTLVCDMQGGLLPAAGSSAHSFFPYFMLVAFEGGSIFRAFILLLCFPFVWLLDSVNLGLRAMIFVTFFGLRKAQMDCVGRAVLPKFYLENLDPDVYDALASAGTRVVITGFPRVMVEGFLKEYLGVDVVKGTELHTLGGFFTGLVLGSGPLVKHRALKQVFGEKMPDIGVATSGIHDRLFLSLCKEACVVNDRGNKNRSRDPPLFPREKYPKPLIFHDGRLAFLPTPLSALAMFIWLPVGLLLAIFRIFIGTCLPYKAAMFLGSLTGMEIRVEGSDPPRPENGKGVLYVCTHRTLLDPVFLSTVLAKPLTAVTYSLSKMSEILAPIRTVRLKRDRKEDGATMERMLREGDLVVCPEGTTCREPYLLRFSSLFAELADEIVPVAMDTSVGMFYGTTASGLKCLDPLFFLMNPRPTYRVHILGKVPKEMTCGGGGGKSSFEVANYIQRQLADALGFECTTLTRRDKYLMLAGNDGIVENH